MSKILYVGYRIDKIKSGSDSVNKRNLNVLLSIFPEKNIIVKELAKSNTTLDKLRFYIGGLNKKIEVEIINILKNDNDIHYVFLSQSLLGRVAEKIKKKFGQKIKIVTFYHNIEKHYAKEFIKTSGIFHYPFYLWASYNELKAVKFSNINIVLNKRDSIELEENYKLEANLILPVTYEDNFDEHKKNKTLYSNDYLFVGTSFFANLEAVRWFIKNVLPFVPGKLLIVGKGMDDFKNEFENEKVSVEGFVDDLSEKYYESNVVIAPIISGGGMKTKIAEALMYGKLILGSQEAFEGYVKDSNAMILCNTAEDYIKYLNSDEFKSRPIFNIASRECFINNYSNDAVVNDLKSIFNE